MGLDWKVVGPAATGALAVGHLSCVAYDLMFSQELYRSWMELLPECGSPRARRLPRARLRAALQLLPNEAMDGADAMCSLIVTAP
jgi:hypothetical protein